MAARPPLPPSRAGLPRRVTPPAGGRRGFHAATKAGPGLLRWPRPGKLRAPPGGCPRGLTKPTRSGGGVQAAPPRAPAPSAHPRAHKVWGPAGSGPGHAARRRAGTSWARPLPVRGLPHVPLPPPLCSGGALTLAPERNFPCPGTPRPACARSPGSGGGAGLARPFPEGPLCAPRARPPAPSAGPGRVRAGPGRGRRTHAAPSRPPVRGQALPLRQPACERGSSEWPLPHAGAANGPRPAPVPGHAAAATLPPGHPAPPARPPPAARRPPPSGPGPHTTGFTHSAEGRADSPGGVAATIFASPAAGSRSRLPTRLRFTTTGGPRPGVRPAGRPAPRRGLREGARAAAARRGSSPPPRPRPRARSGAKAQVGQRRQHLEGPCG